MKTKVYRTQILEGFSLPAFIHNGTHFFVDLDVYENGRVNCWNFQDFDHFMKDVERGWVATSVPNGQEISIHGTGSWLIDNGNWLFDSKSFVEYIKSSIKELNPTWQNIYTYQQKKIGEITISESGTGTVYKNAPTQYEWETPKKINGDSVQLFYKEGDLFYLAKVNIFADGSIELNRLPKVIETDLNGLKQLVKEKVVLTHIPKDAKVCIHGLGSFVATKKLWGEGIKNKLAEIEEILRKLKGEPTFFEICRAAYEAYLANPTAEKRKALKEAYEKVPEHQRMYLGDMDTKDVEIRMIIYGEEEIENWSHYQLAKQFGDELPNITLPKEKK